MRIFIDDLDYGPMYTDEEATQCCLNCENFGECKEQEYYTDPSEENDCQFFINAT